MLQASMMHCHREKDVLTFRTMSISKSERAETTILLGWYWYSVRLFSCSLANHCLVDSLVVNSKKQHAKVLQDLCMFADCVDHCGADSAQGWHMHIAALHQQQRAGSNQNMYALTNTAFPC